MRDINFFLPYLETRKVKFNKTFFLNLILIVCFFTIVGYGGFNYFKIQKLTEEMDKLSLVAEDPKTLEKVEIISLEEEELKRFTSEVESIRSLKTSVDEKDFINAEYLDQIVSKKPRDLFLNSINISTENINISGISDNRLSIAEFGKGIKSIDSIKDIFISNISKEENNYNFDLEVNLVEEVEDGDIQEGTEENKEIEEKQ